jgi:hypothetical protein
VTRARNKCNQRNILAILKAAGAGSVLHGIKVEIDCVARVPRHPNAPAR